MIKQASNLFVSFTSMTDFRICPRYYYWKRIKRLELPGFNVAFIVGRIMHHGVQTLFSNAKKAEEETAKMFQSEAKAARKGFHLTVDQEQELAQQEYVTMGMLRAYRSHYHKFLKDSQHLETEKPIVFKLNDRVTVVGKLDNIIRNRKKKYVYELKNLKSLDMERIESIKTDPQTSLYFELHNQTEKKKDWLDGIIYQIIRKPQIRQKQKETTGEFLNRLENWYEGEDGTLKFYLDRVDEPFVSGAAVLNTVDKVSKHMLECSTKEDYYQDFSRCVRDWGKCEMYDICHKGEKPEVMRLYQIRPSYHVAKEGGIRQ